MDPYAGTAEQYADFAGAAAGDSPCFEEWGYRVAEDAEVLAWLDELPVHKRQPNLVFAAARWHAVRAPGPYDGLRRALLDDDGPIRATILERATQTNEVGRLATLMPAFVAAAGPGPLALVEVGASAGLCLYPDCYDYAWSTTDGPRHASGVGADRPILTCDVIGEAPLPTSPPEVAWRGGVDLNPLDVTDADQMRWLATLVWPEDDDRRARLARAIEVARHDPPQLVQGDLLEELPALVAHAAGHGSVVVFHSAVITYVPENGRRRFEGLMVDLVAGGRCHWVSNEAPNVLPDVARTGPPMPQDRHDFVLGIDGHAVAWAHGHGRRLHWF